MDYLAANMLAATDANIDDTLEGKQEVVCGMLVECLWDQGWHCLRTDVRMHIQEHWPHCHLAYHLPYPALTPVSLCLNLSLFHTLFHDA